MNNNNYLETWGKKIAHVLDSNKTAEETKDAIENILVTLTNENQLTFCDPAIIEKCFPTFINCSPNEYGRGVLHSLQSIINNLPEDQKAELNQFDDSFINKVLSTETSEAEQQELYNHFVAELQKAVKGRICTPERMAQLYPIFREINSETDRINAATPLEKTEAPFITPHTDAPMISSIPHSKPAKKRGQPKVEKRPAKKIKK